VLKYTNSAIHLTNPAGGEDWSVGSLQTIHWKGGGEVDLYLSVDGGDTFDLLLKDLTANAFTIRVPNAPTRYGMLRLQRNEPLSTSNSEDFLTIEVTISPLFFDAKRRDGGEVVLSWLTKPGPEGGVRYRLERASEGDASFAPIHNGLLREQEYIDRSASPISRYRLIGVDALGGELILEETVLEASSPLAVWPLPFSGGELNVTFSISGGIGDSGGEMDITLYDPEGREIKRLVEGRFDEDQFTVTWDGRDESGAPVGNGVYFIQARNGDQRNTHKILVLRKGGF
jgi:hypothetical protein